MIDGECLMASLNVRCSGRESNLSSLRFMFKDGFLSEIFLLRKLCDTNVGFCGFKELIKIIGRIHNSEN